MPSRPNSNPLSTDPEPGTSDRCTLCDVPTPQPPVTGDDVGGTFCCPGCLDVYRTIDSLDEEDAAAVRDRLGRGTIDSDTVPEKAEECFLHVSGMHCSACEAFLETVAEQNDGIYRAEASYASEMVRLHYDENQYSKEALPSLLNRSGYTASLDPADVDNSSNTVARLLFGGFFTMMVMVWYIVFLYPVYAGGEGIVALDGEFARYVLGNVWVATTVVLGITGWPLLRSAGVSLRVLKPNMDLLITLAAGSAYFYSVGALLLGQVDVYFDVAVVIIFVVSLGRYFEAQVKERATGLLADLTRETPQTTQRVNDDGSTDTVEVDALDGGNLVRVREGERIPMDGTVTMGRATVDESLLTGEAHPVSKGPGDLVIGGGVVQTGPLEVRVGNDVENTRSRLMHLMWQIQASKTGGQRLADRLASVFVPLVLVLGLGAVGLQLFVGTTVPYALLTGLTVLIVSCPCALGLATPLAVAAGTQTALKRRLVVKNADTFDEGAQPAVIAFDKTGTLTTGQMRVLDALGPSEALQTARAVETWSPHPVAEAITNSGPSAPVTVDAVHTHARGMSADVDGRRVFVGHPADFRDDGGAIPTPLEQRADSTTQNGHVPVIVGVNGEARGLFVVGDTLRDEADAVLDALSGRTRIVVCTGDHEEAAAALQADPRIDDVWAEVRPEAKRALLQQWRNEYGPVVMVGDGSNDAPALADADLGVAFGPTALAADSADAVILDDDLTHLPALLHLATETRRRIRQNLGWAFAYNAVAIPLAIVGWLNPLAAALAMTSSSLLVVGNSARSFSEPTP